MSPQDPSADTVTITRAEYDQLIVDAGAWRMLRNSEHILNLLAEWIEWDRRRNARQISAAFSDGVDWKLKAYAPTYAELERRRNTYLCPTCDQPLQRPWNYCTGCGWTEPTVEQKLQRAHESWARYGHDTNGQVAS